MWAQFGHKRLRVSDSQTIRIRLTSDTVDLDQAEYEELIRRTKRHSQGAGAARTLRERRAARSTVTFTPPEKLVISDVMHYWLDDVGADELGPRLFKLRNAILDDLDWAKRALPG